MIEKMSLDQIKIDKLHSLLEEADLRNKDLEDQLTDLKEEGEAKQIQIDYFKKMATEKDNEIDRLKKLLTNHQHIDYIGRTNSSNDSVKEATIIKDYFSNDTPHSLKSQKTMQQSNDGFFDTTVANWKSKRPTFNSDSSTYDGSLPEFSMLAQRTPQTMT